MITIDDLYYSDVTHKRQCAHELYEKFGDKLLQSEKVRRKLAELEELSAALQRQMGSMTMFELCMKCAVKPGGGCCSAYMANETDSVLLLINLLLGCEVKIQRDDLFECCYLGLRGCTLRVKPMFCLNYNCRQILNGNGPEVLKQLERAASAVLRAQTALETILLEQIRLA